jgi:hypothetical protein
MSSVKKRAGIHEVYFVLDVRRVHNWIKAFLSLSIFNMRHGYSFFFT